MGRVKVSLNPKCLVLSTLFNGGISKVYKKLKKKVFKGSGLHAISITYETILRTQFKIGVKLDFSETTKLFGKARSP